DFDLWDFHRFNIEFLVAWIFVRGCGTKHNYALAKFPCLPFFLRKTRSSFYIARYSLALVLLLLWWFSLWGCYEQIHIA
ncbi:MAG: hypothetical protein AAFX46_05070, partial [Cyanobacteria bacterium J06636_27]